MAMYKQWDGFNKHSATDQTRWQNLNSGSLARRNSNLNISPSKGFSPTSASAQDALRREGQRLARKQGR